MRRFSDIELEAEATNEQVLRAADAIRAFEQTDGWLMLSRGLHKHAGNQYRVLESHAAMMTLQECAFAAGAVQTVAKVDRIFKDILAEAKKIRDE